MNRSCSIALFAASFVLTCAACAEDAAAAFQTRIAPILKSSCTKCHGAEKQKAKINFAGVRSAEQLGAERELWFRVLDQVEYGKMPPEDEKPLADSDRQALVGWIRGEYAGMLAARQMKEGRSSLRRLNRNEYANTIEDLFGVRPAVEGNLPEDGRVDGFDKVGGALPLSADGAYGYFTMADEILKKWVLKPLPRADNPADARLAKAIARPSEQSKGHILELDDGTMVSFNTDTTSGPLKYSGTRIPGLHRIRLSVYGYQTDKPLPFGIYVGNTWAYPQILELVAMLDAPPGKAAVLETEVSLRAGVGIRLIPFGLGVPVPKNSLASKCTAPGLAVQWMEVEEPERPLPGDRWLLADFPKALSDEMRRSKQLNLKKGAAKNSKSVTTRDEFLALMETTFKRVGARLFRRDLTAHELSQIKSEMAVRVDEGVPLETIFFDKLTEMLTAPDFLCVIEAPGKLNDFVLASRLSYFLWNSTPDETLLELARKGKLSDPKVLKEQADRVLDDPKSARFVNDFVNQWLGLRAINDTSPDSKLYPGYDEYLKFSSVQETRGFFRRVLQENLSVRNFVESRWLLANDVLAKLYGLPDVSGSALRKVDVPDTSPYGGVWTQSAVMKVTANGTNTSPVKRGVWVAERLLGTPIPPPPPNIKPVEPDVRGAKTLREQLALHSSAGSCMGCHAKFDPYGFALESFDVTGRFRKFYRQVDPEVVALPADKRKGRPTWQDGLPVDCAGKTPDGRAFAGIVELRKMLAQNPELLARGVARHLITYATGARYTAVEQQALDGIVTSSKAADYGLRSTVHAVVQSELFRWK